MIPVVATPPGPTDGRALDVPGGFVWWYVDLVDAHGDGLVLIASFGLPFLPGLLDAARRGAPVPPRERPALSLAVYIGGKIAFYLFDVPVSSSFSSTATADTIVLGGSTVDVAWEGDRFTLVASLDTDGAGERITGNVRVSGRSAPSLGGDPVAHAWSLLCGAGEGAATLRTSTGTMSLAGRAYVDRNLGERPIDALGMTAWTWARVAFPGGDLVVWDVDGASPLRLAVWATPDGRRDAFCPALVRGGSRLALGASAPRLLDVDGRWRLQLGAPLESSPFYARFPVIGTDAAGQTGRGFAERCLPQRIDAAWMRPLVRMCVQQPRERSRWLPLFAGPAEGRLGRLVRSWRSP